MFNLPTPGLPGKPPAGAERSRFGFDKYARQHVKVLVVDDMPDNADSLCSLIEAYGCSARAAYSAQSGLAIAYEWSPRIIFHDLAMPGMSGFDAMRVLRADERFSRTMIIAHSAYMGQADSRARYQGFDRLVTKPMAISELAEILESAGGQQHNT
jgi:CheY-like chemotaxis protein